MTGMRSKMLTLDCQLSYLKPWEKLCERKHPLWLKTFNCAMMGRLPHTPKLSFPVLPRAQWYLWLASPSLLASLESTGPPSSASLLPPPADEDLNTGLFHILLPQCVLQITRIGDRIKQAWVKEWRDSGNETRRRREDQPCQCWQGETSDQLQLKTQTKQKHKLRHRA